MCILPLQLFIRRYIFAPAWLQASNQTSIIYPAHYHLAYQHIGKFRNDLLKHPHIPHPNLV